MGLSAEVQLHQGAPTLFLNDTPHPGLMFWHSQPQEAAEDIQRFARAGVYLFTTGFPMLAIDRRGRCDFAGVDKRIRQPPSWRAFLLHR